MHLAISVLPYKFKLILSQKEELVVPGTLDGFTHVVQITLIVAECVDRFTFTGLKWKKIFQCGNETRGIYVARGSLPRCTDLQTSSCRYWTLSNSSVCILSANCIFPTVPNRILNESNAF